MKLLLALAAIAVTAHAHNFDAFEQHEFKDKSHSQRHGSSPLMSYHGGPVLLASKTEAIFWGSQWSGTLFASDKISGMDAFFNGFGGSNYSQTSAEYTDSSGDHITGNITYLGHVFDASAAPSRALSTSQAVQEVCKITSNSPDPQALYLIYTSSGAGHVNYCAWHSWGSCSNGASVQVAYIPNLDGIAGCDPLDTSTTNSEGLAAIANVTAHELMETITDPSGTAWYDNGGNEIGDKCAWSFPPGDGVSTLVNGAKFKVQMEWSNAAYTSGTGQPNLSGQNGCIY